jgi:hypothetical protein
LRAGDSCAAAVPGNRPRPTRRCTPFDATSQTGSGKSDRD